MRAARHLDFHHRCLVPVLVLCCAVLCYACCADLDACATSISTSPATSQHHHFSLDSDVQQQLNDILRNSISDRIVFSRARHLRQPHTPRPAIARASRPRPLTRHLPSPPLTSCALNLSHPGACRQLHTLVCIGAVVICAPVIPCSIALTHHHGRLHIHLQVVSIPQHPWLQSQPEPASHLPSQSHPTTARARSRLHCHGSERSSPCVSAD